MTKLAKQQERSQKYYNRQAKDLSILHEDDIVRVKPIDSNLKQQPWSKGIIRKRLDTRSYQVELNNKILRRNRIHLRKTNEKDERKPNADVTSHSPSPPPDVPQLPLPPVETLVNEANTPNRNIRNHQRTTESTPRIINKHTEKSVAQESKSPYTTRSGRLVKAPVKLDV